MQISFHPILAVLLLAFFHPGSNAIPTSCLPIPDIANSDCPNPGIIYVPSPTNASQYGYLPANKTQYNLPWASHISTLEYAIANYLSCHHTAGMVGQYLDALDLYGTLTGQVAADAWNCVLGVGQPKDSEVVSRKTSTRTSTDTFTWTEPSTTSLQTLTFTFTFTSSDFSATATASKATRISSATATATVSASAGNASSAAGSLQHQTSELWSLKAMLLMNLVAVFFGPL